MVFLDARADFIETWVAGYSREEISLLFPALSGLPGDFEALAPDALTDLKVSAALAGISAQLWEYCHAGMGGCFHVVFDRLGVAAATIPAPEADLAAMAPSQFGQFIGPDLAWSVAFAAFLAAGWWLRPGMTLLCVGLVGMVLLFFATRVGVAATSELSVVWTGPALRWFVFEALVAALFLVWGAILGLIGSFAVSLSRPE
ncbi:MAG: hypothetical protein AAGI70_08475 [Pseudomonadota bacterium]